MEQERNIRPAIFAAIFFLVATLFILVLFWRRLPPQVPLFYSRPWGEEQLGTPLELWIFPGCTTLVILWTAVTTKFLKNELLLLQITITGAILFSFLSLFALSRIIILTI